MQLGELFEKSYEELELMYEDYKIPSRATLWLMPGQQSDHCVVKGSDLILMFFQGSMILYCERVQLQEGMNSKEVERLFNKQISELPSNVNSKVLCYEDFVELQLYRKEYLEWVEENT